MLGYERKPEHIGAVLVKGTKYHGRVLGIIGFSYQYTKRPIPEPNALMVQENHRDYIGKETSVIHSLFVDFPNENCAKSLSKENVELFCLFNDIIN